jgi:hypothetical protein
MENLDSSTDLELTYAQIPSGIVEVPCGGGRCSYHMVKPCRSRFPEGQYDSLNLSWLLKRHRRTSTSVNGSHSVSVILTRRLLHLVLLMHKIMSVPLAPVARISYSPAHGRAEIG